MKVIVTRPAAQAEDWVLRLRALHIDAVALPLIGIAPAPDESAVRAAWGSLESMRLVVFVSPNAAEQFFAMKPEGRPWPQAVMAGATGPGTSRVLRGLGVPAAQLIEPDAAAAQFDSEALWERLRGRPWQGARVLLVRGDGGRDWLADTLGAHGAEVRHLAAYRRVAPVFTTLMQQQLGAALAQPREHLWFFSSSEAVTHLSRAAVGVDWALARALATHPRIAATAQQMGFGSVIQTQPSLEAVSACIQSIPS